MRHTTSLFFPVHGPQQEMKPLLSVPLKIYWQARLTLLLLHLYQGTGLQLEFVLWCCTAVVLFMQKKKKQPKTSNKHPACNKACSPAVGQQKLDSLVQFS